MFCTWCNLYLMNHQGNGSSYTKMKFSLCENYAKLHQETVLLIT